MPKGRSAHEGPTEAFVLSGGMELSTTSIRPDRRLLAITVLVAVALLISITFASFSGATPALSASVVNFCSSQSLGVAVQNSGSSAGAVDVTINGTTTNLQVAPGTTERALVAAVEGHTYTMTATVVSGPVLLSTTVIRDCEGGTDGGGGDDSADGGDDSTDDSGGDDGTTTTAPTTTMPTDDGGDGSTTVPANGDTTENGELPVTGPAVLYVQLLTGLLVLCVGMVLADMGRKRLWL